MTEAEGGMKTVEDLEAEDLYILARPSLTGGGAVEFIYAVVDEAGEPRLLDSRDPISGEIEIAPFEEGEAAGYGPCDLAWQVKWASTSDKWGPLLYDVAIEYATKWGHSHCAEGQKCNGLIADRVEVSHHARAVWDYYLGRRSDVDNYQLDDLENTLTPDIDEDNCDQYVASLGGKYDWQENSLSKRYTKQPITIDKLIELGRFIDQT